MAGYGSKHAHKPGADHPWVRYKGYTRMVARGRLGDPKFVSFRTAPGLRPAK
jgi:hypothetical protein